MPEPERSVEGVGGSNVSPPSQGQDRSGGEAQPPGSGILGVLMTPITMIAAGIAAFVSELWHDRTLAAFGRQGIDELGTAIAKPFPDSIQVDEIGTIWNPTQRGIDDDGRQGGLVRRSSLLPPPGWSAEQTSRERGNVFGRDNGQDKSNDQDQGISM